MANDDWTVADTDTAAEILLYLGIGSEASKEPFIDRRRDRIATIIRKRVDYEIAQEREGCAFAAECHSGFGDPETIDNCAALIRARAEDPEDCIHVPKEIYARLTSSTAEDSSGTVATLDPDAHWGRKTIAMTFMCWNYSATIKATVGGNCVGLSNLDAALSHVYENLPEDIWKTPYLLLRNANGEQLEVGDDEGRDTRWLETMLVSARLETVEPGDQTWPSDSPTDVSADDGTDENETLP